MKRIIYTIPCLLFVCLTAFGQFFNSIVSSSFIRQESSAIELKDGFVFGFTESNTQQNFHENILLIKTDAAGNLIWSKHYDAGIGISVRLIQMIRTFNDEILISGETGADNNFTSSRCILKIGAAGKLMWAKRYTSSSPYNVKGLVQLKDSSFVFANADQQLYPDLVQINSKGNVLQAIRVNNKMFESISSITAKGNTADFIVSNSNVANINFKTHNVSWQRQYNTSNQFTAFLSNRCSNGDIVYLAGRTSGGTLDGTSRMFLTDANGNLKWAKNIDIRYDSGQVTSIFDIVNQVSVHEDVNGNIVAVVQAESTNDVMVVLNAAGKYLYHRFLETPDNFIVETSNGNYLHTSPLSNTPNDPVISYRSLTSLSTCDSTIFVTVKNGTDSAATLNELQFATINITALDFPVSVSNAHVQQNVYCSLSPRKKISSEKDMPVTIIPNPASDKIFVKTNVDIPFCLFNMNHVLMTRSTTNHSTDISNLTPGIYLLEIKTNGGLIRKIILKR